VVSELAVLRGQFFGAMRLGTFLLAFHAALAGARTVRPQAGVAVGRALRATPPQASPSPAANPVIASASPPPRPPPPSPVPPNPSASYLQLANASNLAYLKTYIYSGVSGVGGATNRPSAPNAVTFFSTSASLASTSGPCKPSAAGPATLFVSGNGSSAYDPYPWLQIDLGAPAALTSVEAWFGRYITNMTAVNGCSLNVYASSLSHMRGGLGSRAVDFSTLTNPPDFKPCLVDASATSSPFAAYSQLAQCNTTARYITVQLGLPGRSLPNASASCGALYLCSVQAYGAFLPQPAPSSALTVAFIESFAIPIGVFVLLAIPFAFALLFRHAEARKQRLLEHWPVITPKRLVVEGEAPEAPPTRGKALLAEAGGRSPQPSDWALNAQMGNLDEQGGYGSALVKAFAPQPPQPASPGAQFTNPMFGGAQGGAPPDEQGGGAAPPPPPQPQPKVEAWY